MQGFGIFKMIVLNCDGICFSAGAKEILSEVSFYVEEGDKVGVIGVNGAGKTTLFRIITGELQSDKGSVSIKKDASIGVLRQEPALNENDSVYSSVMGVFATLKNLELKMAEIERRLAEYDAGLHENNEGELGYLQKLLDMQSGLLEE
jgi:ATP-binding cassette subfamily F protein 3